MKKLTILLTILLILPLASAIDLDINQKTQNRTMIVELDSPSVYNLEITNNGEPDEFKVGTYFTSNYSPQSIYLDSGETKEVELKLYPPQEGWKSGSAEINYYLIDSEKEKETYQVVVEIFELKDVFDITADPINPNSNSTNVYVQNKANFNFDIINATFYSDFFEINKKFSLNAKETKEFNTDLKKENLKKKAGHYSINSNIYIQDQEANPEGKIKLNEENAIQTQEDNSGFFIRKNYIKKSNEGSLEETVNIEIEKGIISRLFTSFNESPDETQRENGKVFYIWNEELNPGESFSVEAQTNWFLPIIVIAFLAIAIIFLREYLKTDLKLKKKITFANAKGGEFALKVSLIAHAKKDLKFVSITDKYPLLLKIYPRFGRLEPNEINHKNREIKWKFDEMKSGDKKIMSYILYSKVGIVGKFALPQAKANYEKQDKSKETTSNKVMFIAEHK